MKRLIAGLVIGLGLGATGVVGAATVTTTRTTVKVTHPKPHYTLKTVTHVVTHTITNTVTKTVDVGWPPACEQAHELWPTFLAGDVTLNDMLAAQTACEDVLFPVTVTP